MRQQDFSKFKQITNRDVAHMSPVYSYSDTLVAMLGASLPGRFSNEGYFCITFKETDAMFLLNDDEIKKIISREERSKESIIKGPTFNGEKTFIAFGNFAIHLSKECAEQLYILLEDYFNEYEKGLRLYNSFIGVESFRQKDKRSYILDTVNIASWSKIIKYAERYSSVNGSSEEFFFAKGDKHSVIGFASKGIRIHLNCKYYDDETIQVIWNVPETISFPGIETGDVWTAQQCYNWVNNVIEREEKKESRGILGLFK